MEPTSQQELILEHNGNEVIIAAPGSGKTFVISEKIKRIISTSKEHQGVIAISYTNKASNELRERCLKNGLPNKGSFFGTIDKFNISEIIIPFAKQLWGLPISSIEVKKINTLEEEQQSLFTWFSRSLEVDKLENEEISLLKDFFKKGIILLDTVGLLANYVFTTSIACRKYLKAKYSAIYIDEYQDSGVNQHELFLKIVELGITGSAVGDLNQSIYEFSGKSAKFLSDLITKDNFKHFRLDKNHRCHPSIINYSNYLLDPKIELIPADSNRVFFHRIKGNEVNISIWLDGIIKQLNEMGIKNSSIAVLTRANRTAEIIDANLKTPHKLLTTTELDRDLNIWSAIFNSLLYFLFDSKYMFSEVVSDYISFERVSRNDREKLISLKKTVLSEFDLNNLNTLQVVDVFSQIAEIFAPNSQKEESQRLLIEILNSKLLLDTYKPVDENEINIMTLHKSKGLEFDIVFHLDLYEWVFPQKSPGPNSDWKNPTYSNMKQDINLHYVGITRAKQACFLISSTLRTNNQGSEKVGNDSEFVWMNNIDKLWGGGKKQV